MKILLFGGTSEGRELCKYLHTRGFEFSVCVATDYAKDYILKGVEVITGRKGVEDIKKLVVSGRYTLILDATHPYADLVTQNIQTAVRGLNVEYIRIVRDSQPLDSICVTVENFQQAVEYLTHTVGNVLLTTGVKNLKDFTSIPDYQNRVFARVLDTPTSLDACQTLGYKNIIPNSGTCNLETNVSHIELANAKYLVTKESGTTGGFSEKVQACKVKGVVPIVITRPLQEEGLNLDEALEYLSHIKDVYIVGIGMGNPLELPPKSLEAINSSEVLIGAKRMVETFNRPSYTTYHPDEIAQYINTCEYSKLTVLMSGDTGFFSGTKKLLPLLRHHNVKVYSGTSSVSYLSAKVGIPWDSSEVLSVHGRSSNYISAVDRHPVVYLLTGGNVSAVCESLVYYHLEDVTITLGENLSLEDENITTGKPSDYIGKEYSSLSVMCIENPHAIDTIRVGIPDSEYVRGRVPMTKAEVRAVSVSKCMVDSTSTCWDIGAGTGSVSVELALLSPKGTVYAVEKNPEGVALIRENARKFRVSNVVPLEGNAETVVQSLPSPDVVFIGGSSGSLKSILEVALTKNPQVRVVANCITLETLTTLLEYSTYPNFEVTQVAITRTNALGKYHMLKAENPVYVVAFNGC
jgi:precorrin-6Y C5,15-methyltransferase (decarboxylating)